MYFDTWNWSVPKFIHTLYGSTLQELQPNFISGAVQRTSDRIRILGGSKAEMKINTVTVLVEKTRLLSNQQCTQTAPLLCASYSTYLKIQLSTATD